jgi:hypothetical protein
MILHERLHRGHWEFQIKNKNKNKWELKEYI